MTVVRLAAALALLCAAAGPLSAQTPPAKPDTALPESTPPATSLDGQAGSLSSKLRQSNGVIQPGGDVDPAMPKAAPQTGSMPVIKPGQTGGGAAK